MNNQKIKKLEGKGWKVGTTQEFLNLSPQEVSYIEVKVALSQGLKKLSKEKNVTQIKLAKMLGSSQSRVSKMENGDSSVSIDLLIRSLFSLGVTKKGLVQLMLK